MNKNIIIILGVVVIIIGGIVYSRANKEETMMVKDSMESEVTTREDGDALGEKDETSMVDKGDAVMRTGSYEAYSPEKIVRAEAGDVVLFFHASWCPSCRALNSDIENNVGLIPEGVSILKTDYDKETELKKKYGVTYQHTLVQVDKDGNMTKKWSGSPKLASLVSEIQ